jgi:hypothetical protein
VIARSGALGFSLFSAKFRDLVGGKSAFARQSLSSEQSLKPYGLEASWLASTTLQRRGARRKWIANTNPLSA